MCIRTSQPNDRLSAIMDSLYHWRETARPRNAEESYQFENGWAYSSLLRRVRGEDLAAPKSAPRAAQPTREIMSLLHVVPEPEAGASLYGLAVPVNKYSRDMGDFVQRIELGAIRIYPSCDLRLNHDSATVFGRTGDSGLETFLDHDGLKFRFTPRRRDPLVNLAFFLVNRRGWDQCSFGYTVTKDRWQLAQNSGQIDLRIITGVEVHEISVLDFGAFPDAQVGILRKVDDPPELHLTGGDGVKQAVEPWMEYQDRETHGAKMKLSR